MINGIPSWRGAALDPQYFGGRNPYTDGIGNDDLTDGMLSWRGAATGPQYFGGRNPYMDGIDIYNLIDGVLSWRARAALDQDISEVEILT